MPLVPDILQIWLFIGLVAILVVRLLARMTRMIPRVYSTFWWLSVASFGIISLGFLLFVFNVPLYSEHKPARPDNYITPAFVYVFYSLHFASHFSLPILFALGLSPPNFHNSRRARYLATIPIFAAIAIGWLLLECNQRYRHDFEFQKSLEAQRLDEQREWHRKRPPDPKLGPKTHGEWAYLGAIPTYSRDGNHVIELQFGINIGRVRPEFDKNSLVWLKNEVGLHTLRIYGLLDDNDIVHLKPLTWIKRLELTDTQITDKAIAELTCLTDLEYLSLVRTPVTAASINTYSEFPSLREVKLITTKITESERKEFGWGKKWLEIVP